MRLAEFKSFSAQQKRLLTFWKSGDFDGVIADGAVRSGKTICGIVSFVLWAFSAFSDKSFAVCGKSVSAVRRNVINEALPLFEDLGFSVSEHISQNYIDLKTGRRKNRFYLFGGHDESSRSLIQGITLGGAFLDEAALMPRSFVLQAMARCSLDGAKLFYNCNPENPFSFFYREFIKRAKEKRLLYLHFTMDDNPSLSAAVKTRYKNMYSGNFYERYVLGKWVQADGLVYPDFNESNLTHDPPNGIEKWYLSVDYGTRNPFSCGLWGRKNGRYIRFAEFYYDSSLTGRRLTDSEYYEKILSLSKGRQIEYLVCDPSASSFMELCKRRGAFPVIAGKNDVLSGISAVSEALFSGTIKIGEGCLDARREFSLYRWDENSKRDSVIKENDHAMDDIRYFVCSIEKSSVAIFFGATEGR